MRDHLKFSLPEKYSQRQLTGALAEHYVIRKEPTVSESMAIYDTFDWRLFNKSLVLCASQNNLFLRKLYKNKVIHSAAIASPPVFLSDLPEGELKDRLAPVIKMRALLKLVELHSRLTPYRALNRDEKTVARLVYEETKPAQRKNVSILAAHLWVQPLKGYTPECQTICKHLEAAGFKILKREDIYFKAIAAAGKKAGGYSSKLNIRLDPAMRSDEAAKAILRYLLRVVKINAAYLEKDLDTEFLHDFRVATRRIRSALGQIKSVFPMDVVSRFKSDFAFVGKVSNPLRDLDVYLLREQAFKALLPPALRSDIDPLFDYLRGNRSKALQKVIRAITSKKYSQIMRKWESFLDRPVEDFPPAANAGVPVFALAQKRIWKQYRRVLKDGGRILEDPEEGKLHALRIECKKLRYLMEFFASLFPPKKIKKLIARLKTLQDKLGDYNDLCVQEKYLLGIAEKLPAAHRKSTKTAMAIGSLIGALNQEKRVIQDAIAKTIGDYASSSNKRAFGELFASQQKETVQ